MLNRVFIVFSLALLTFSSAFGQQFSMELDDLEKTGYLDSLTVFNNYITNHWDQENHIQWIKESNVPDDWYVEICQGSLQCWGPWIVSDTLSIGANVTDTLQVKFRARENLGTGSVTLRLIALADTNIQESYTFTYHAISLDVKPDESDRTSFDGLRWDNSGATYGVGWGKLGFHLPSAARYELSLHDISGRLVLKLYEGVGSPGFNSVPFGSLDGIAAGAYLLKLSAGEHGVISDRLTIVR